MLVLQEKPAGAVPEAWLAALAASGLATNDMAGDLAALLSPKDEEETKNVRKAAYLVSNALIKFAVPQLESEWAWGVASRRLIATNSFSASYLPRLM